MRSHSAEDFRDRKSAFSVDQRPAGWISYRRLTVAQHRLAAHPHFLSAQYPALPLAGAALHRLAACLVE
ncbi:MAG TPA: hypothetical protein VFO45_09985 [Sphingomicrobium sp.]|nr:hypothetical protein [Sphingomicrobium sp.]